MEQRRRSKTRGGSHSRPALGSAYKARKHDRRRDEVLDAAAAVFAAKGFHNATLKDIADHIGVLAPSLYHYIDSKEAALIEVCRRSGAAFIDSMQVLLTDTRSVPEILRDAIRHHIRNNRGELVYSFAFRRNGLPDEVLPDLAQMASDYQSMWEDLIARGIQRDEISGDVDPRTAAIALLAMMNGAIEWYQRKTEREIDAVVERFATLALAGLVKR
jgi:AcrR family transcriptional regulator